MSLLKEVAELAAAFAPSAERRLETLAQGTAFLDGHAGGLAAARAGSAGREPQRSPIRWPSAPAPPPRPAAGRTAQAFAQAFAANLVSAGVRLIPLGQTDGLRVSPGSSR